MNAHSESTLVKYEAVIECRKPLTLRSLDIVEMTSKKALSERDICTQFIVPALKKAGWDIERQVSIDILKQL